MSKGLVITVKRGDDILGHLMVGKASLHWFEKKCEEKARKISWDELITFMRAKQLIDITRP